MANSPSHDPYLALRYADFRLLLTGNAIAGLGGQMLTLAIGWELYQRTNSALALGFVGLVQLLPVLGLSLITGHVADQHNRKTVVILSQLSLVLSSVGLAAVSYWHGSLVAVYVLLLLRGIGAAFRGPAAGTLPAEVVPEDAFENSVSWTTSIGQVASIVGPALGGLLIAAFQTTTQVYLLNALAGLISIVLLILVRGGMAGDHRAIEREEQTTLRALAEGINFLRRTPVILSAMTLDLFAVLFGGATTLLPIFARDILQVGPSGLGWLVAAPSVGAVFFSLYLAHRPPLQKAGSTFLLAVAGFGLATIVFGFSRSFWLSLASLFLLGGLDGISMVVRDTLMLTRTPHEMRGRVAAIEGIFVGSSNQLGGFESGVTAQLFGPILSVIGGGIGTIVVVLVVAAVWPELRRMRTLRDAVPEVLVS